MDWLLALNLIITAGFVVIVLSDLVLMAVAVNDHRAQEGWADDLGWVFLGAVIACIFICGVWVDNLAVLLVGFVAMLATRQQRIAATVRIRVSRDRANTAAETDPNPADREDAPR